MALTIGDNFNYQGAKPLDARLMYVTLAEMAAKADSTLYNGILAYCVATDKTYQWKSTNTVDPDTGKWREFTSGGGGQTIQVDTLPTAGADEVGHIYEYIGNTSASFINGRFYKCVTDGTTYEWAEVLMNDKFPSGGDAGQALVKNSSTDDDVKWGNPEKGRAKSSAIAPIFDDTVTYAEGDRVTYEDELYVFNKAHTGAWDAADADKSDVDSEIPDAMSASDLADIKAAFNMRQPVQYAANPTGCIIQMMAVTAPVGYLACDGTVYNIADYQKLADFFEAQFGTKNNFGGDGTTTFAVPDLRGEFLRGTGTNSHLRQGSGANVGEHQDGTVFPNIFSGSSAIYAVRNMGTQQHDYDISSGDVFGATNSLTGTTGQNARFTSRPTNTSVLYCIKY